VIANDAEEGVMADEQRKEQSDRFREAVERKNAEAREHADDARARSEEEGIAAHDRQPGEVDPRTKSSRHGQVTADKWNQ
jgi:hypothetical protein